MKYPLKQETSSGTVDFEQLIVASGEGLDTTPQKARSRRWPLAYQRAAAAGPALGALRQQPGPGRQTGQGLAEGGRPVYQNAFSVDSFVTLMMFDGTLKPA